MGEAMTNQRFQKAVANSATVKESNNYTNADETQKTAYDNAVTAAQTVLDKANATQAEVNQALQDLETANSKLNGDAKTEAANKAALEAAVKDAPNVRNTPAYYNGRKKPKQHIIVQLTLVKQFWIRQIHQQVMLGDCFRCN